jgi:hypothetical protein
MLYLNSVPRGLVFAWRGSTPTRAFLAEAEACGYFVYWVGVMSLSKEKIIEYGVYK